MQIFLKKHSFLRRLACGHIAAKGKVSLCVCLETFSPLLGGGLLADTKGPFFICFVGQIPPLLFYFCGSKGGARGVGGEVVGEGSLNVTVYNIF